MQHTYFPRLRRFLRDESGAMSIELLLVFPLLVFVLMGAVVFFEGFRARANSVKATYTIADALSREHQEPITPEYLDNLYRLYGGLLPKERPETMRVSVVRYDDDDEAYEVLWSEVRGTGVRITDAMLTPATIQDDLLPEMVHNERGIIVETVSRYSPAFGVGIRPLSIRNTMILRPRFYSTLCWSDSNDGPWTAGNQIC
jgi:Flp pilus assembly pilin Flp